MRKKLSQNIVLNSVSPYSIPKTLTRAISGKRNGWHAFKISNEETLKNSAILFLYGQILYLGRKILLSTQNVVSNCDIAYEPGRSIFWVAFASFEQIQPSFQPSQSVLTGHGEALKNIYKQQGPRILHGHSHCVLKPECQEDASQHSTPACSWDYTGQDKDRFHCDYLAKRYFLSHLS